MKLIILLIFLLPYTLLAAENCDSPSVPSVLDADNYKMIENLHDGVKNEFKRRPVEMKGFHQIITIETNFNVPLIGKDKYWGRIFLRDGDTQNVMYRDEMIAEDKYKTEAQNPKDFYHSYYAISDINSSEGLALVKAAGAEVIVKSSNGKFNIKTGGRLNIKVKAPGDPAKNLVMQVERSGNKVSNFLIEGKEKIKFDSFKINAEKSLLTGTSILIGIQNIEFYSEGKVIHIIN